MSEWYQIAMACLTGVSIGIAVIIGIVSVKKDNKRHKEKMKQLENQFQGAQLQHVDNTLLFGNADLKKEELVKFKQSLPGFSQARGNHYMKKVEDCTY